MFSRRSFIRTASALAALVTPLSKAWAQAWPSRPIKFVVPLTPGGANDYLARLFSERLQSVLGQPVVVENKPGVGGNIGRRSRLQSAWALFDKPALSVTLVIFSLR